MTPVSIRDVFGPWMKPMGALIYFHQWIDQELADLIWLIEAREEALCLGHWATKRSNQPIAQGGTRIRRFAELARSAFAAFACFIDIEARTTIDRLVDDLKKANSFRNTLVHGRWSGHANGQLTVFDSKLTGDNKWILVTPEEIEACGRKAYEVILRLREFNVWVQKQNAEVTRRQASRSIIRLVRARGAVSSGRPNDAADRPAGPRICTGACPLH